jgi:hypothetical protein
MLPEPAKCTELISHARGARVELATTRIRLRSTTRISPDGTASATAKSFPSGEIAGKRWKSPRSSVRPPNPKRDRIEPSECGLVVGTVDQRKGASPGRRCGHFRLRFVFPAPRTRHEPNDAEGKERTDETGEPSHSLTT